MSCGTGPEGHVSGASESASATVASGSGDAGTSAATASAGTTNPGTSAAATSDGTSGSAGGSSSGDGATTSAGGGTDSSGDTEATTGVAEPKALRFTDVTIAAGLTHKQGEFHTPPNCLVDVGKYPGHFCTAEWETGGAAVGDADGDGHVDLYFPRIYGADLLYHNQGDGTFVEVAAASGLGQELHSAGAAFGDIDSDGDLDLYVTTVGDTRHYLFINDGAGHFSEEAMARGAGLFGPEQHVGTTAAFGDIDLDGYLDLYVGEYHPTLSLGPGPSYSRLLRNRGVSEPGVFDDVTDKAGVNIDGVWATIIDPYPVDGAFPLTSALVDLDGDDYPELAIAADFHCSRLFWNEGDGLFIDGTLDAGVGTDQNGMGAAFGDYDGDGDLDWFVTSIESQMGKTGNRLYRYDGERLFSDATDEAGVRHGEWGWGAAFADFDNDGDLDLTMTNGWNSTDYLLDPMHLWENQGPEVIGVMVDVAAAAGVTDDRQGRGLLTLDFDEDGDLDLLVINNAAAPVLYRNDSTGQGRWLRVRAPGTGSDVGGKGAVVRVRATAEGPTQMRMIGEPTYLGHGEGAAHFGLGDHQGSIAEVRVRWPASAKEVVLTDVDPGQVLIVAEP